MVCSVLKWTEVKYKGTSQHLLLLELLNTLCPLNYLRQPDFEYRIYNWITCISLIQKRIHFYFIQHLLHAIQVSILGSLNEVWRRKCGLSPWKSHYRSGMPILLWEISMYTLNTHCYVWDHQVYSKQSHTYEQHGEVYALFLFTWHWKK